MPTKHPRISITKDPELAGAMRTASLELPGLSNAALVRELALRVARTLPEKPENVSMARIIERTGARPASGNLLEYLRRHPPVKLEGVDSHAVSDALQELREDKI